MVEPRAAGDWEMVTPADWSASILCAAVPLPPEMIAPAWPMRRPGGAVAPAMKPTIGFFTLAALEEIGRVLLGAAADLADHDDAFGLGIAEEHLQAVDEVGAVDRIAADADAGRLAQPRRGGLRHRLVGQRAGARDDADLARAGGYGPA